MGITVLKNNVPWGPFTRAQIDEGLERGDFTLQVLAHAPGMTGWFPLEEVIHNLEPRLPPVPMTRDLPPVPTERRFAGASPPALPIPPRFDSAPSINSIPLVMGLPELRPAPFFKRACAFVIDCAILFLPILALMGFSALTVTIDDWWNKTDPETMRQEWALWHRNFRELLLLVAIGLGWIYAAGLECSPWQGTIGKKWLGIKVTDANGERLGFLRATGRHLGKYLSALPCFLGFIMALFSSRGLAWHDRLADTRVVRN